MNKLPNSTPHPDWREYIEKSPLYTRIAFSGQLYFYDSFYNSLKQIEVFCPNCKRERFFDRINYLQEYDFNTSFQYGNILSLEFSCVEHCCNCIKRYYVFVERTDEQVIFTKCGEYPSLSPRIDEVILKVFPKEAELLRKAAYCLNDGFGVGAFAYLRQALEDRIDVFIAEIRKYAEEQGDEDIKQELDKLHEKSKMSDIIEVAKKALPASLQTEGYNPLGLLYQTLSDGVHGLSDRECLEKASAIYDALSYILKTLAENSASRKKYVDALKSLCKKKTISAAEIDVKNRDDKK